MTRLRDVSLVSLTVALAISLSGCFGFPGGLLNQGATDPTTGGTASAEDALAGSTWEGVDSDGDSWVLEFQEDRTLGFAFNDASYDDASDTWSVVGSILTISIVFNDGIATMTGPYAAGDSTIDLDGEQGNALWTLTIAPQ
ncbi:MAG: hypothetical protein RJQ01_11400 [Microcella sp.]|uniref:hypothetical protein n=1 Tax=Microcella sp. TaxID=1913979 RepID=UPI0033163A19